ncbi:hypothetical protein [Rubinisphaera italica]|uniref:Uncharacterized protein n=1 Tax=Rubinisphaera italica TaxID=2527969 RepID=A0A5C5XN60_9PLAN|nr:hypothetical protein [Rubinisphaera italica]TWT63192.1 hypothetical protein Pan54_39450 [Rubinisphaera italica]
MTEINPIDDRPVQLACLYVDKLNLEFAGTFLAKYELLPEQDLKDLKDLTVRVIPGELLASELADRGDTVENEWLIGISFQQRVERSDPTKTNAVLQIVRQVRDYLNRNRIVTIGDDEFLLTDIASDPYLDRHLLAKGQCYSGLVLSFKEWEDIDE